MGQSRFGTIYCLRGRRRGRWRLRRYYIGQTRYRDYRKRVDQHLFGYWYQGEWHPPKTWAHEVVDYYPMWQGERWSDWGIDAREFLCIRVFFPVHNVMLNTGNPRRVIPPPVEYRVYPTPDQITAVERWPGPPRSLSIPQWPAGVPVRGAGDCEVRWWHTARRAVSAVVTAAVVVLVGLMCLPGWPVAEGAVWMWDRRLPLVVAAGLVVVAGALARPVPRRRRRRF